MKLNLTKRNAMLLMLILSMIGFADAAYLTAEHYAATVGCVIGNCSNVLNSPYAAVLGVPLALIGALYYLITAVLILFFENAKAKLFLSLLLTIAFVVSLGLVYLQIFTLRSICVFCMVSALTTTLLFFLNLFRDRLLHSTF